MVTPGGGGGACSFSDEQPAQITSAIAKRIRNEDCLNTNLRSVNETGSRWLFADFSCGHGAMRKSRSFFIRIASQIASPTCTNETLPAALHTKPQVLTSPARRATDVQVPVRGPSLERL